MWFLFEQRLLLYTLLVAVAVASIRNVSAERKSREKCKEYGKLVYTEEASPVLRIGGSSKVVSKCGIVETPLIIGGVKAKPMEFPHMAVVGYGDPVEWLCGGSVISDLFILTAAHCLDSSGKPASKIRVGLTDHANPESTMEERTVVEKIPHPEYKIPARYHDIALLKIDKPLKLGAAIRPACLEVETNLTVFQKEKPIASGFGTTAYGSKGNTNLMKVSLDWVPTETCSKHFTSEFGGRRMSQGLIEKMLCAGVMEGGKDTCQGDSGGPLQRVLKDPYCTYSLVGVTSFGKFCGFKNSPAIYTKVSSYLDWIESIVWP